MPPDTPTPPRPPPPAPRPPEPPVPVPNPDQSKTILGDRPPQSPPGKTNSDAFAPRSRSDTKTIDTTPATPTGKPETNHFDRKDRVDSPRDSAARILDLSQGRNAAVKLDGPAKAQFEQIRDGKVPVSPEQAKALEVLRGLADKTADRRAKPGANPDDQLVIMSYMREKAGRHTQGLAFDISAYGGHSLNEWKPAECRQAVDALVRDLPPGNYGFGLTRLPTKYPIPDGDPAHMKKYEEDVAKFSRDPKYDPAQHGNRPQDVHYEHDSRGLEYLRPKPGDPKSSEYGVIYARPTDRLRNAEDPFYKQPTNAGEIEALKPNPKTHTPAEMRWGPGLHKDTQKVFERAEQRGVHILAGPKADGPGHVHFSVLEPGAKKY